MLLSGAFLLALVLLGVVVAATGGGSGRATRENADDRRAGRPRLRRQATASGCRPSGRQSDGPVEQPAAGAVGDGRVDAGAAEPGRVRTGALRRTVGDVLCPQSVRRAAGRDEPLGRGNGRATRASCLQRLAIGAPTNLGSNARLDRGGPIQFAGYRYESYTPIGRRRWRSSSRDPRGSCSRSSPRWSGTTATGSTCSRLAGTPVDAGDRGSDGLRAVEQLLMRTPIAGCLLLAALA